MNRIESATEILSFAIRQPLDSRHRSAARTVERIRLRGGELTPHATFAPMHYEPGYAYPLVIWLHGALGDERQVRQVMPQDQHAELRGDRPARHLHRPQRAASPTAGGKRPTRSKRPNRACSIASRSPSAASTFTRSESSSPASAAAARWRCAPPGIIPADLPASPRSAARCPRDDRPLRNVNALRQLPCFVATGRTSQRLSRSRRLPRPPLAACGRLHRRPAAVSLRRRPHHHDARGPQPLDHGNRLPAASIAGKVECQMSK